MSRYTGRMTTHEQQASGHRPSRLATAIRSWALLLFLLLIGVGCFLAGGVAAETRYGETGLWVGLAGGVGVAVGAALGVQRAVHAPQRTGIVGGAGIASCGALAGMYLLRAFDLTIALDPMGGFLIGLSVYLGVHQACERVRRGPAVWDDVAARRQALRQARR